MMELRTVKEQIRMSKKADFKEKREMKKKELASQKYVSGPQDFNKLASKNMQKRTQFQEHMDNMMNSSAQSFHSQQLDSEQ